MGCSKSKEGQALAAEQQGQKSVPESWKELDNRVAARTEDSSNLRADGSSNRGDLMMKSALIDSILKMMGASKEQLTFWEVWSRLVHDEAVSHAAEEGIQGGQQLYISADLRFLEVRVTGNTYTIKELLKKFAERIRDMPQRSIAELEMIIENLQERMLPDDKRVTAWAKFKHIRSEAPPPSIDCGYLINQDLQWAVIDVMMPSHEDQDALREYALNEKHLPVLYGSSILPIAPEKQIGFELQESAAQNSRQILLTAFFFFKALGLMKPEDRIVKILNSCQCGKLAVTAAIGPEGLVRLALSLIQPRSQVAKELAEELAFAYRTKEIEQICTMLNGEPDVLEYVGEMRGYVVRLGFVV
jgi:hypothetical protein